MDLNINVRIVHNKYVVENVTKNVICDQHNYESNLIFS